jgi:hypothetical protein
MRIDDELTRQELRGGWLDLPRAHESIDFFGAALGAYFMWAGATGRAPRWSLAALGGIMFYVHGLRFFTAPRTGAGLVRLLRSLDVRPQEVIAALEVDRAYSRSRQ